MKYVETEDDMVKELADGTQVVTGKRVSRSKSYVEFIDETGQTRKLDLYSIDEFATLDEAGNPALFKRAPARVPSMQHILEGNVKRLNPQNHSVLQDALTKAAATSEGKKPLYFSVHNRSGNILNVEGDIQVLDISYLERDDISHVIIEYDPVSGAYGDVIPLFDPQNTEFSYEAMENLLDSLSRYNVSVAR